MRVTTERVADGLCVAVIAASLANLLRPLLAPEAAYPPFDLIHFWRAGAMWLDGGSPYAPAYEAAVLPEGYLARPFFYPPAARVFFEPLALRPFEAARAPYTLVAAALWASVCWQTARALPLPWPLVRRAALLAAIMAFALPQVRLSTEGGQTTVLIVAALAGTLALTKGPASRWRDAALAACFFVLMLKPPLGLAVCLVLALRRTRWRALALAAAAVTLATLYGAGGRPDLVLPAFLGNASRYDDYLENGPLLTSGLGSILHAGGLPAPGGPAMAGLVALGGAVLGAWRRAPLPLALFGAVALSLLLLPSHSYDYLALLPFAPLAAQARGAALRLLAVGGLILAQASAITRAAQTLGLIHADDPGGAGYLLTAARLDCLGIVLVAGGVGLLLAKGARAPTPTMALS